MITNAVKLVRDWVGLAFLLPGASLTWLGITVLTPESRKILREKTYEKIMEKLRG